MREKRIPGLKNVDMSIFKNVYFDRDRGIRLEIRGEAFNVSNTPIFSDPNVTFGSSAFGTITGVQNSARVLQIALKLNF